MGRWFVIVFSLPAVCFFVRDAGSTNSMENAAKDDKKSNKSPAAVLAAGDLCIK